MTKYARVIGDVVDTVSFSPDRVWIDDEFGEDGSLIEAGHWGDLDPAWVEVADDVFQGFVVNADGGFSPPAEGSPGKVELAAYARATSWRVRVAGTEFDGVHVALDDGAIALINGLYVSATRDPDRTFSFDTASGSVTLDSTTAVSLSIAISDWVQLTFDRRALVLTAIEAGEVDNYAAIDAAFEDVTTPWAA